MKLITTYLCYDKLTCSITDTFLRLIVVVAAVAGVVVVVVIQNQHNTKDQIRKRGADNDELLLQIKFFEI